IAHTVPAQLSPDGKYLAFVEEGPGGELTSVPRMERVSLWDVGSGRLITAWHGTDVVRGEAVAVATLAGLGADPLCPVARVGAGFPRGTFESVRVAFTPDGGTLLVTCGATTWLLESATGKEAGVWRHEAPPGEGWLQTGIDLSP